MFEPNLKVVIHQAKDQTMAVALEFQSNLRDPEGQTARHLLTFGVGYNEALEDWPIGRRFKIVPVDDSRE